MAASVQQSQVIGLVSEVSQLHADLTKSVAVCQQLRKENNAIKAHYDNLRTKHVDLVEKHKKTSKQLLEVIEAKVKKRRRRQDKTKKGSGERRNMFFFVFCFYLLTNFKFNFKMQRYFFESSTHID